MDFSGSSRSSEVVVCLIPAMYIGMHSPVLGPAFLHWDTELANCQLSILLVQTRRSGL
jgi:hypothetical protein